MSKLVPFVASDVFFFRIEEGRNAFEVETLPLAVGVGYFVLPAPPFLGSLGYDLQWAKQFCYGRLWALAFARYCSDSGADIAHYHDDLGGSVLFAAFTDWMPVLPRGDIGKSQFFIGVVYGIEELFEGGGAWLDALTPERWNQSVRELFAASNEQETEAVLLRLKSDLKQSSDTVGAHA